MAAGQRALAAKDFAAADKSISAVLKECQKFSRTDLRRYKAYNLRLSQYYAQGDLPGAKSVFESLIAFVEDAKGVDHQDAKAAMNNYDVLLKSLGDAHATDVFENRQQSLQKNTDGFHSHIANLTGMAITDSDAAFLLHGLNNDIWDIHADDSVITDRTLQLLASFPNLERLFLTHTMITDAGLRFLNSRPKILQYIVDHTAVTDAGVAQMKGFPRLMTLGLAQTKIKGETLGALMQFPKLQTLNLADDKLTNKGWEQVAMLSQLRSLDLTGSNVTDAAIERIAAGMPRLRNLNLYQCAVTDKCAVALKKLPELRRVNFNETKVSAAVAAEFEKLR